MQLPALINPWIGSLADRISVRWLLVLAPSLTAVPMGLIGVTPTYGILLVLMMISFLARSAIVVIVGMTGDLIGLSSTFSIFALVGFIGIPFVYQLPADSTNKH